MWVQTVTPPNHQNLAIQIPEVIGIPVVAFAIMTMIRAEEFTTLSGASIGTELSILAAGACGAIFANDTLQPKFGVALTVYGVLVVLLCVLMAAVLSRIKRKAIWVFNESRKMPSIGAAIWHLILGAIPIALVTGLLIMGYTWTPGR